MDRHELAEALSRIGLTEYEIADVHTLDWYPSEYPYLCPEQGHWVVGICERGIRTQLQRFPEEDAACRFFYDLLAAEPPPPPPAGT